MKLDVTLEIKEAVVSFDSMGPIGGSLKIRGMLHPLNIVGQHPIEMHCFMDLPKELSNLIHDRIHEAFSTQLKREQRERELERS